MILAAGFITYNEASLKYLADFLPSLEGGLSFLPSADYEIYAFDNSPAEKRENSDFIRNFNSRPGRHKEIICLSAPGNENVGFGRAYNIMLDKALEKGARYFLIINPDTLLDQDSVLELARALDEDEGLGSAAPKVLRWDFKNRCKTSIIDTLGIALAPGLRFTDLGQGKEASDLEMISRADHGSSEISTRIIGPSGAAGLFRMGALLKIAEDRNGRQDFFDRDLFMYKEDCDLDYRLMKAGFRSRSVLNSIIFHDRTAAVSGRGAAAIINDRQSKSRQVRAWSFKNQHLLFVKHWKNENFYSHCLIVFRMAIYFIYALILEQFLLKEYPSIWRFRKH